MLFILSSSSANIVRLHSYTILHFSTIFDQTTTPQATTMAYIFPRVAFSPARCAPTGHELAPLFSLFDGVARQLQQVERVVRQPVRRPFNPRFDVSEDKSSYILEGEVPGFKDADLSIEWNDDVLAIRGRHETVTESDKPSEAIQAQTEQVATQDVTPSETGSVKSHQPTVSDEADGTPSNAESVTHTNTEVTKTTSEAPVPTQQPKPKVQSWISERKTGEFLRQFRFSSNAVEHESIKASLQSGILKIVVPKAAAPASRRINIE